MGNLLTRSRKVMLLGAAIFTILFVYVLDPAEDMVAPFLGQYLGQFTVAVVGFMLALVGLWVYKKTQKHV